MCLNSGLRFCLLRARPSDAGSLILWSLLPLPSRPSELPRHTQASDSCAPGPLAVDISPPPLPWPALGLQPSPSCQVLFSRMSEEDDYPDTFALPASAQELGCTPGQARPDKYVVWLWSAFPLWGISGAFRVWGWEGTSPLLRSCSRDPRASVATGACLSLLALSHRTSWLQEFSSSGPEFIGSSPIHPLSHPLEGSKEREGHAAELAEKKAGSTSGLAAWGRTMQVAAGSIPCWTSWSRGRC